MPSGNALLPSTTTMLAPSRPLDGARPAWSQAPRRVCVYVCAPASRPETGQRRVAQGRLYGESSPERARSSSAQMGPSRAAGTSECAFRSRGDGTPAVPFPACPPGGTILGALSDTLPGPCSPVPAPAPGGPEV